MDPFAPKTKKPVKRPAQNFVEALKSIGGHTVKTVSQDVFGGMGRDAMNSIFGGSAQSADSYPKNPYTPETPSSPESDWAAELERRQRHQEVLQATPIYDRREEEVKAQIKALQDELKALAKDLANTSFSLEKAISEEVAHPGQYHISFFEKLRRLIINLRKQVNDANNWLEASYARRQAKQHYWGGVRKAGTKFMLSQERQVATSAG